MMEHNPEKNIENLPENVYKQILKNIFPENIYHIKYSGK